MRSIVRELCAEAGAWLLRCFCGLENSLRGLSFPRKASSLLVGPQSLLLCGLYLQLSFSTLRC